MEPKLKVIWDNLLDQLEKNTLTPAYLTEKLEPFFNYMIFKTTDDLNNDLLNYALIYKNTVLMEFIFNKINFNSLENEVKERIAETSFSILIAMTKNLKQNLNFLLKFFDIIGNKSFKEIGNIFITQSPFKMKINKKSKDISNDTPEITPEQLAEQKVTQIFSSNYFFFFWIFYSNNI